MGRENGGVIQRRVKGNESRIRKRRKRERDVTEEGMMWRKDREEIRWWGGEVGSQRLG